QVVTVLIVDYEGRPGARLRCAGILELREPAAGTGFKMECQRQQRTFPLSQVRGDDAAWPAPPSGCRSSAIGVLRSAGGSSRWRDALLGLPAAGECPVRRLCCHWRCQCPVERPGNSGGNDRLLSLPTAEEHIVLRWSGHWGRRRPVERLGRQLIAPRGV